MNHLLREVCERPDFIESFELVECMIRDSIVIASSNYDFVSQNLKIFASFSILNRMSSSLKSESSIVENMLRFAIILLREAVFETVKAMGIPRFVPFEKFRELCVNDKDDAITLKVGENKINTLRNVMLKQNLLDLFMELLSGSYTLVLEISTFMRYAKCSNIFTQHFRAHLNTSHVSTLIRRTRDSEQIRDIVLTMLHVNAFDMTLERHMIEECFGSEPFNISNCTLDIMRAILMKRNYEDEFEDSLQHRVCFKCIDSLKSYSQHNVSNPEEYVSLIEFAFSSCRTTSQLGLTKELFNVIFCSTFSTQLWCLSLQLANIFCTWCSSACVQARSARISLSSFTYLYVSFT